MLLISLNFNYKLVKNKYKNLMILIYKIRRIKNKCNKILNNL